MLSLDWHDWVFALTFFGIAFLLYVYSTRKEVD